MENDTIFNKSILCALALFSFSSATAMDSNVVFVGKSSKKHDIINEIAKINKSYEDNNYDDYDSCLPPNSKKVTFTDGTGFRYFTAMVWDTPSKDEYAHARQRQLCSANVIVLTSCANGTVAAVNAELNYYFDEVINRVIDPTVPPRTLVLLEEGGSPAIQAWCLFNNLECVEVPASMDYSSIADIYYMIGNRLA
jgi:uncharacterized protein YecT (DUF1311 family)